MLSKASFLYEHTLHYMKEKKIKCNLPRKQMDEDFRKFKCFALAPHRGWPIKYAFNIDWKYGKYEQNEQSKKEKLQRNRQLNRKPGATNLFRFDLQFGMGIHKIHGSVTFIGNPNANIYICFSFTLVRMLYETGGGKMTEYIHTLRRTCRHARMHASRQHHWT